VTTKKSIDDHQIGYYLPVSVVFPQVQSDFATFQSLLSGLSRTDTLFWCARLNLITSATTVVDSVETQQLCLNLFFTSSEIEVINDFAQSHGGASTIKVFFRGQLLELFRWVALFCIDHSGDGTTFEDPEVRRKFVQAALIASDVWANRIFKDKFSLDGGIELARRRALGPSRMSVEAIRSIPPMTQSLGRGWTLFKDYFPKHYPAFDADFFAVTRISLEQYFVSYAAMVTSFMNPSNNVGFFDTNKLRERSPFGDVFSRYLELEAQDADELKQLLWNTSGSEISQYEDAPADYYRSLREKPILHAPDGRGIIFDTVFYSEKAAIGPLFHILKSPTCRPNDAFSAFGQAFEEYILDMLGRMFGSPGNLVNRFSKNVKALDSEEDPIEIDAILNDVFEVVLFEVKSTFIPENVFLCDDYETLLHTMRERYSRTRTPRGGIKLKGVGQLARTATSLAIGKWAGDGNEFRAVRLIYPVLIVHDSLLTSPVYGNFFASEFAAHLQPDSTLPSGIFVKGDKRIAPVIVMSADDLENLETSIEHFSFRDLLADYSSTCSDRLMSLHNFIAFSEPYRGAMYANRNLASSAHEILNKCSEAVFGEKFSD
jgi:hypothetical protein